MLLKKKDRMNNNNKELHIDLGYDNNFFFYIYRLIHKIGTYEIRRDV